MWDRSGWGNPSSWQDGSSGWNQGYDQQGKGYHSGYQGGYDNYKGGKGYYDNFKGGKGYGKGQQGLTININGMDPNAQAVQAAPGASGSASSMLGTQPPTAQGIVGSVLPNITPMPNVTANAMPNPMHIQNQLQAQHPQAQLLGQPQPTNMQSTPSLGHNQALTEEEILMVLQMRKRGSKGKSHSPERPSKHSRERTFDTPERSKRREGHDQGSPSAAHRQRSSPPRLGAPDSALLQATIENMRQQNELLKSFTQQYALQHNSPVPPNNAFDHVRAGISDPPTPLPSLTRTPPCATALEAGLALDDHASDKATLLDPDDPSATLPPFAVSGEHIELRATFTSPPSRESREILKIMLGDVCSFSHNAGWENMRRKLLAVPLASLVDRLQHFLPVQSCHSVNQLVMLLLSYAYTNGDNKTITIVTKKAERARFHGSAGSSSRIG